MDAFGGRIPPPHAVEHAVAERRPLSPTADSQSDHSSTTDTDSCISSPFISELEDTSSADSAVDSYMSEESLRPQSSCSDFLSPERPQSPDHGDPSVRSLSVTPLNPTLVSDLVHFYSNPN